MGGCWGECRGRGIGERVGELGRSIRVVALITRTITAGILFVHIQSRVCICASRRVMWPYCEKQRSHRDDQDRDEGLEGHGLVESQNFALKAADERSGHDCLAGSTSKDRDRGAHRIALLCRGGLEVVCAARVVAVSVGLDLYGILEKGSRSVGAFLAFHRRQS